MIDYKNEPDFTAKYVEKAAKALVDKIDQATWDKIKEMFHAYYQADVEALLSQHSKKRELEAETKLLEHLATSNPRYTHAAVMDLLQDHKDRIKQLGGQDE